MALSSDDWPRFSLLVGATNAAFVDARSSSTAACYLQPASDQAARELLDVACSSSAASTWECWLQLRVVSSARSRSQSHFQLDSGGGYDESGSCCWVIQTPGWRCGVDSNGAVQVQLGDNWYVTAAISRPAAEPNHAEPDVPIRLQTGRWHHLAVTVDPKGQALELFVDGRRVPLSLYGNVSSKSSHSIVMTAENPCFQIGVSSPSTPDAPASVFCVLHDFRAWKYALDETVLADWMAQSISTAHPNLSNLVVHWGFSSCSESDVELDLSGNARHLYIVKPDNKVSSSSSSSSSSRTAACWLRIAPPRLKAAQTDFVVETLQDSSKCDSDCRFLIKIRHRDQLQPGTSQVLAGPGGQQVQRRPCILVVCNFLCFKSTSVTNSDEGKWVVALLKECVRSLPESAVVGLLTPSSHTNNHQPASSGLFRSATVMDSSGKSKTCKALDQLTITTAIDSIESLATTMESGIRALVDSSAEQQSDANAPTENAGSGTLSFTSVIVINSSHLMSSAASPEGYQQSLKRLEVTLGADAERLSVSFLHLEAPMRLSTAASAENLKMMPPPSTNSFGLFTEFAGCAQDLERALANVMLRISQVSCTSARLKFQVFGSDDGKDNGCTLTLDSNSRGLTSQPKEAHSNVPEINQATTINFGVCAQSETLVLSGTFSTTCKSDSPSPFVELSFQYLTHDRQLQVARVSIRLRRDLTSDMHVARVQRNHSLLLQGDNSLLLEQRRQLMDEKDHFHHALVTREVGELENGFKRINIMKEELWARRKWIIQRGLRRFEESELCTIESEALQAAEVIQKRFESLQAVYTVNARENSRGVAASDTSHRVQTEGYHEDHRRASSIGMAGGEEEEEEEESHDNQGVLAGRFKKLSLKVDLLSNQFRDLESRMEDIPHSVCVSQVKGFVIMNDTRKAWMVLFHDLLTSKRKVLEMTRERANTEFSLVFLEHKQVTIAQMLVEIKKINSAILRYDKEHVKRKKRAFFCMKDVLSAVQLEARSALELDTVRRTARQCRLMRSPALNDPVLYSSCIHVFFPMGTEKDQNGSTRRAYHCLNNTVHSLLFGLRHFCHEASQSPFCRRIALQENFLWLDQEQLHTNQDGELEATTENDSKRDQVRQESWAVVVFTYNALFSSPVAVSELKKVLSCAEQKRKQVLHIQLETPLASLDAFKSSVNEGGGSVKQGAPPVEKQYLLYKQNLTYFQVALARIMTTTTSATTTNGQSDSLAFAPLQRECARCLANADGGLPCIPCCWPTISRSTHSIPSGHFEKRQGKPMDQSHDAFLAMVSSMGQWVDALALSATTHAAVRSHNIDPKSSSSLFLKLEGFWNEELKTHEMLWEEGFSRRKGEIHRQLAKLSKVNEEEANELVQLRFTLMKRKQVLISACSERFQSFQEELKLLKTLAGLKMRQEQSECALQTRELALMVEQEVVQALSEAEQLMATLNKLEEDEDTTSEVKLLEVKEAYHEALKRSVQKILELGKQRVDNQLRVITKSYATQQEHDEMEQLAFQSDFEQSEIKRADIIFSQGIDIVSRLIVERKQEIVDEARAFVQVSRLEQRKFSAVVGGRDLDELRKHARDVDEQSLFRVSVLFDKLLSELMADTANGFRVKVKHALQVFESFYTPAPSSTEQHPTAAKSAERLPVSVPSDILKLKEFCSLNLENPHETWGSLQRMTLIAANELLNVRDAKLLLCDFKTNFQDEFVGSQLEKSRKYTQSYLEHLTKLLAQVKDEKDQSLQRRLQSKRALRTTIEDREQCKQRTLALQSKLTDAKARNRYLLQILQQCRGSYEKALEMSDRLQNFKMDPLFKSWFAVGEFHTSSIADWFDLRANCAEDVANLEKEMQMLERQLERLNDSVEQKRLQWMKESITDVEICERAEQLQDLVHHAVDEVVETEEARVFHSLSYFDLRHKWLDNERLRILHDGETNNKDDSMVNQNLVQLSIARLDSIKQEKRFDALVRKLRVYERIQKQETEKQQMVSDEIYRHRALSDRLLQRVRFVTQQVEQVHAVTLKAREKPATASTSNAILVPKRDTGGDSSQLVAARQELEALMISASKDHLVTEAHLCQLCWRLQEQIATSHRIDTVIQRLTGEIQVAEKYLGILKATDSALYHQGISGDGDNDTSSEATMSYGERIRSHLPFVLRVFEYYTRQRWSTQALERTTSINAMLRSCKDRLAFLNGGSNNQSRNSGANDSDFDGNDALDEEAEERLRESLETEETNAELELLLNRFECRIAEHTSEALWDKLDAFANNNSNSDSNGELQVTNSVVSIEKLRSWLFSTELCLAQKSKALELLRKVTTDADARDVGGNIAEVVYGANLDGNEIKQVYLTARAKHVIDEQWRVTCLVVLFFARLFRRAALQKAAKRRKLEAAALTSKVLAEQKEHSAFAHAVRSLSLSGGGDQPRVSDSIDWSTLVQLLKRRTNSGKAKKGLKNCIRHLQLEHQERGLANVLARVYDGLVLARPLHHALDGLYDLNHEVQALELHLEHVRAEFEHQPPKPSGLELVSAENNAIKIKWTPLRNDMDLLYAAEIQLWKISSSKPKQFEDTLKQTKVKDPHNVEALSNFHEESGGGQCWNLFVSDSKQSHTFFNLQSGEMYCVRVRSGCSKSKWGKASHPLFVKLQRKKQGRQAKDERCVKGAESCKRIPPIVSLTG